MNSSAMHVNFDPQKTDAAREREHKQFVLSHTKPSEKYLHVLICSSRMLCLAIAEVY